MSWKADPTTQELAGCPPLSAFFRVLPPMKLRITDSLVSQVDRLAKPGPVYIKRQVHTSKMDPVVDEVELSALRALRASALS